MNMSFYKRYNCILESVKSDTLLLENIEPNSHSPAWNGQLVLDGERAV